MVRVRSRPVANCGGYALVTVDVEPAAERSVTVAEDFITAPGPYRELYAAELADEALVADLTGARWTACWTRSPSTSTAPARCAWC